MQADLPSCSGHTYAVHKSFFLLNADLSRSSHNASSVSSIGRILGHFPRWGQPQIYSEDTFKESKTPGSCGLADRAFWFLSLPDDESGQVVGKATEAIQKLPCHCIK
jgi:hypothetical protein